MWLSIRSSGGLFWTRYWTLGFRKGHAVSSITYGCKVQEQESDTFLEGVTQKTEWCRSETVPAPSSVICHEDVWGSGDTASHILNLGTRCRGGVIIVPRSLYPWRNSSGIPCGLHSCCGHLEEDTNLYTSLKWNPDSRINQPLTRWGRGF